MPKFLESIGPVSSSWRRKGGGLTRRLSRDDFFIDEFCFEVSVVDVFHDLPKRFLPFEDGFL